MSLHQPLPDTKSDTQIQGVLCKSIAAVLFTIDTKRKKWQTLGKIQAWMFGKTKQVDHNVTSNFPPSFPLLKNHFTLIHKLPRAVFSYFKDPKSIKMEEGNA